MIRLLDRGANIRYSKPQLGFNTPLHLAAKRGFSNVAKILIERDLLERGLLKRGHQSTDNSPAGGIVYCKAQVSCEGKILEMTPLEIAVQRAIELAKDTSRCETFKRTLGILKDKKKCQGYCKFAELMIRNMEIDR